MHILYVADRNSQYGAANSLFQLVSEIIGRNENIKVSVALTKNSDRAEDYRKLGCDVYQISYESFCQGVPDEYWKIPIKFIIRGIGYCYGSCFAVKELGRQMDIDTVDIIHANSSREDFGAKIAKRYRIPLVWHIREFGDLDYNCFSYRKDTIRLMNQSAAKLIAISEAVKRHWIKKGIAEDKIVRIYNGVEENGRIKDKYPRKGDIVRLVMMGSLNEAKGQTEIINAIGLLQEKKRSRVRLDIVGGGSAAYKKKLRHLIKENKLERHVRILGYQKDFCRKLSWYDCGIVCSRCEGFGRVSAEYMMAGLPVIASDTGANPELIEDKKNGLLYQYGHPKDLADKISYLLDHEASIEELGRNAYECAVKKYTASLNASKIYEEYEKLAKGRKEGDRV